MTLRNSFNSHFKPRPLLWAGKNTIQKMKLRAAGKKAKLRESINRRNRVRFKKMGLYDVCEVQFPECWNKDFTWAHGKKDRHLTMEEREFLVIRACSVCHHRLDEQMPEAAMCAIVQSVISEREL